MTKERDPERAAWLEQRRSGIGGSDISAILGVSPWTDSFEVWLDKTGQLPDNDNPTLQRGRVMESAIREAYEADAAAGVLPESWREEGEDGCVRLSGLLIGAEPWMLGSPDALVGETGGWEGKTANRKDGWGDESGAETTTRANDLMPLYYGLQAAWYMEVADRHWWDVSVAFVPFEADKLISAMLRREVEEETIGRTMLDVSEVRHYRVRRDVAFGQALVAKVRSWWALHVVNGEPPELTGSEAAHAWLSTQYPDALEPFRAAEDDELPLLEELRLAQAEEKSTRQRVSTAKAQLKAAIGDAEGLFHQGDRVSWKPQKGRQTLDTARLREEEPAIAARYTKTGAPSRVLRPTWRKR